MWKATLLSRIRAHEVAALILIILAALSSSIFVYAFTAVQGAPCPSDAKPFQDSTMPPRTVFQLPSPGRASICLTVQISGQLPLGGLALAPSLGLYTTSGSGSTYSVCSNSLTNCGGAVSASPAYAFLASQSLHFVVTINAPAGSRLGVYWLWFWACSGGTILSLRIIGLNQTLQNTASPAQLCPRTTFHVSLAFDRYADMIPAYENGTIPPLL